MYRVLVETGMYDKLFGYRVSREEPYLEPYRAGWDRIYHDQDSHFHLLKLLADGKGIVLISQRCDPGPLCEEPLVLLPQLTVEVIAGVVFGGS